LPCIKVNHGHTFLKEIISEIREITDVTKIRGILASVNTAATIGDLRAAYR
jgi:hypothetical protein